MLTMPFEAPYHWYVYTIFGSFIRTMPTIAKPDTPGRALTAAPKSAPRNHRTIDRVTRILEEVVYNPGMTFAELVRALDAPKSSVHGFIRGLLASGWLHQDEHRFYLGPAVYGLTLASGHIRAGLVTHATISPRCTRRRASRRSSASRPAITSSTSPKPAAITLRVSKRGRTSAARFCSPPAGRRCSHRRTEAERESYLRRRSAEEPELVDKFLEEYDAIRQTRIATNLRPSGTRFALATAVHNPSGDAVAAITLVGPTTSVKPRVKQLGELLIRHVDSRPQ